MGKVTKNIFDEIQSMINEAKKNKLRTTIDGKNITTSNIDRLIKDIAIRKNRHKKAQKGCDAIIIR